MTLAFGPTVADARTWLLVAHAAATLYMTGLIWFVQVVHYPLFSRVGQTGFSGTNASTSGALAGSAADGWPGPDWLWLASFRGVDDPKRDRARAGRRVRLNRRQYFQRPT